MSESEFTDIVKKKIEENGLKQAYLADKMGISRQLFSAKLNHKSKWSVDQVSKLSKLLDIPPEIWMS